MNYAMLFLVPSTLANTSYEIREIALNAMETGVITDILNKRNPNNSTINWYDSYRIGGSWSGYLSKVFLATKKLKAFADEVEQTYGWPVKSTVIDMDSTAHEKRQKALKIFFKYFPDFQGDPPFFRDEYLFYGSQDD